MSSKIKSFFQKEMSELTDRKKINNFRNIDGDRGFNDIFKRRGKFLSLLFGASGKGKSSIVNLLQSIRLGKHEVDAEVRKLDEKFGQKTVKYKGYTVLDDDSHGEIVLFDTWGWKSGEDGDYVSVFEDILAGKLKNGEKEGSKERCESDGHLLVQTVIFVISASEYDENELKGLSVFFEIAKKMGRKIVFAVTKIDEWWKRLAKEKKGFEINIQNVIDHQSLYNDVIYSDEWKNLVQKIHSFMKFDGDQEENEKTKTPILPVINYESEEKNEIGVIRFFALRFLESLLDTHPLVKIEKKYRKTVYSSEKELEEDEKKYHNSDLMFSIEKEEGKVFPLVYSDKLMEKETVFAACHSQKQQERGPNPDEIVDCSYLRFPDFCVALKLGNSIFRFVANRKKDETVCCVLYCPYRGICFEMKSNQPVLLDLLREEFSVHEFQGKSMIKFRGNYQFLSHTHNHRPERYLREDATCCFIRIMSNIVRYDGALYFERSANGFPNFVSDIERMIQMKTLLSQKVRKLESDMSLQTELVDDQLKELTTRLKNESDHRMNGTKTCQDRHSESKRRSDEILEEMMEHAERRERLQKEVVVKDKEFGEFKKERLKEAKVTRKWIDELDEEIEYDRFQFCSVTSFLVLTFISLCVAFYSGSLLACTWVLGIGTVFMILICLLSTRVTDGKRKTKGSRVMKPPLVEFFEEKIRGRKLK